MSRVLTRGMIAWLHFLQPLARECAAASAAC